MSLLSGFEPNGPVIQMPLQELIAAVQKMLIESN